MFLIVVAAYFAALSLTLARVRAAHKLAYSRYENTLLVGVVGEFAGLFREDNRSVVSAESEGV